MPHRDLSPSLSLFSLNKRRKYRLTAKMHQLCRYLETTVTIRQTTNSCALIKACQATQKWPVWSRSRNYNEMIFFYRQQLYEFFVKQFALTTVTSLRLEGQAHIALKGFSPFHLTSTLRHAAVWTAFHSMEKSASVRPTEKKDGDGSLRRSRTRSLINLSTLPKSRDERWESALGLLKREESVEHYISLLRQWTEIFTKWINK